MVHVNVGMANALMGLLNAARDNVPILFTSGRTPITEEGRTGARDLPIHWGQEMRDQGGMLREYTKWDYELRYGDQLERIVDRALAIAMTPPAGPVYLSLPREALAAPMAGLGYGTKPLLNAPASPAPAPAGIAEAAAILAGAERPLIICGRGDGSTLLFETLAGFAERFAIPVVEFWPSRLSLATDHPLHGGFDVGPWLGEADAVVVLDAMVPWVPQRHKLPAGCPVIQIGPDPLFSDLPMRSFPTTVAITARPADALAGLSEALAAAGGSPRAEARRKTIEQRNAGRRAALAAEADADQGEPMSPAWISRCLDRVKGADAMLFNELACLPQHLTFTRPDGFFSHSLAGGLGWGLPAALGAKLACPERLVIAAVGDGSYMFANPVACHQLAEAQQLPVLTLVFNNGVWNAVRKSTASVYPEGHAVRANRMPLSSLEPSPRFEMVVQASGGYGARVEAATELPRALERALHAVQVEKRQALLNVICQ
jgi:acetolactate synthase-1/2/3 large subunit